jgi:hypothetical protein
VTGIDDRQPWILRTIVKPTKETLQRSESTDRYHLGVFLSKRVLVLRVFTDTASATLLSSVTARFSPSIDFQPTTFIRVGNGLKLTARLANISFH